MAGLQYYFFPTDFYYPRPPQSVTTDTTSTTTTSSSKTVPVRHQTPHDDNDLEKSEAATQNYFQRNTNTNTKSHGNASSRRNSVCMAQKPRQKPINLKVEDERNPMKHYPTVINHRRYSLLHQYWKPDQEQEVGSGISSFKF